MRTAGAGADARELIAAAKLETSDAKGISARAFGIAPKMREVDRYLRCRCRA